MKIWITKDVDEGLFPCYVWLSEPRWHSIWGEWINSGSILQELCSKGERALKAILNLDAWPKPGECLEYDTTTETGWIWRGE